MPVTRPDLVRRLKRLPVQRIEDLAALAGERGEPEERFVAALWWSWCTPLGYVADRTTLDDMVDVLARKLDLVLDPGDAVARLGQLTAQLAVDADEAGIPPELARQLRDPWLGAGLSLGGASASLGATHLGAAVLRLGAGPIGRLLPLLPPIAKWWKPVRAGASVAAAAGGPLAILLALAAANQALGRRYEKALPLLLALGTLAPELRASA